MTRSVANAAKPLPDQSVLLSVFVYDMQTGVLSWRAHPTVNARVVGKRALNSVASNGYRFGTYLGQYLAQHRVIWKYVHGTDPDQIDHIDGDRSNNRVGNLRSVTPSENCRARGKYQTNTSGTPGVSWNRRDRKWYAFIHADGRMINLGMYGAKEAAISARQVAEHIHGYNVRSDPYVR